MRFFNLCDGPDIAHNPAGIRAFFAAAGRHGLCGHLIQTIGDVICAGQGHMLQRLQDRVAFGQRFQRQFAVIRIIRQGGMHIRAKGVDHHGNAFDGFGKAFQFACQNFPLRQNDQQPQIAGTLQQVIDRLAFLFDFDGRRLKHNVLRRFALFPADDFFGIKLRQTDFDIIEKIDVCVIVVLVEVGTAGFVWMNRLFQPLIRHGKSVPFNKVLTLRMCGTESSMDVLTFSP